MATPDPCSAIPIPSVKQACEDAGKAVGGSGGGTGGIVGNLLGFNSAFDWRHFMMRVAEFGIGVVLVIVAVDAGLKPGSNPVVKSAKKIGKKVAG